MEKLLISGPHYDNSGYGNLCRKVIDTCLTSKNFDIYLNKISFTSSKILEYKQYKKYEDRKIPITDLGLTHSLHILTPDIWVYMKGFQENIGMFTFECNDIPSKWILPVKGMDKIFVLSNHDKSLVKQYRNKSTIYVMKYYIDDIIFNPNGPKMFESDKFVIGAVLDWNPRKGNDLILLSYLNAFTKNDNVKLVIKTYFAPDPSRTLYIVKNDLSAILDAINAKREEKPEIQIITDILTTKELASLYRSFDILLFPSRGEGWGIPVHEAMACGVPVICPKHSGLADFVPDTHFVVNFKETPIPDDNALLIINPIYKNLMWYNPDIHELIAKLKMAYNRYGKDIKARYGEIFIKAARQYSQQGFLERLQKGIGGE